MRRALHLAVRALRWLALGVRDAVYLVLAPDRLERDEERE